MSQSNELNDSAEPPRVFDCYWPNCDRQGRACCVERELESIDERLAADGQAPGDPI